MITPLSSYATATVLANEHIEHDDDSDGGDSEIGDAPAVPHVPPAPSAPDADSGASSAVSPAAAAEHAEEEAAMEAVLDLEEQVDVLAQLMKIQAATVDEVPVASAAHVAPNATVFAASAVAACSTSSSSSAGGPIITATHAPHGPSTTPHAAEPQSFLSAHSLANTMQIYHSFARGDCMHARERADQDGACVLAVLVCGCPCVHM